MPLKPGPYFEVPIGTDRPAPFYALRYDKGGRAQGPLTERHMLDSVGDGVTDVFVFSHGWNNDFGTALTRYKAFIKEFQELRTRHSLGFDREYRPLLAGIFWPSTALVLPWEQGPEFAGDEDGAEADAVDAAIVDELAATVSGDRERFYELAERESLDRAEAKELLEILYGDTVPADPDLDGEPARDIGDLLAAWAKLEAALETPEPLGAPEDFGAVRSDRRSEPDAAGFLDRLDPRTLYRGGTVMQMKDRAGRVGSAGVGPLLGRMMQAAEDETRFHLIGHSYGARLLLVAVAHPAGGPHPRPVDSMLLLQPAVNHLCFADSLPDGRAGGLRGALPMVRQPILSTFSTHDFPLTKTFHLALRRGKDLGEVEIAADEPPSRYAALGGYGPRGFGGWKEVSIKDPTDAYTLGNGAPEVWAVNGSRTIGGHGAVVNESTAWALYNLARA